MAFTRLIDEKRSFSPGNYQVKSKEKNAWNKYCIYKSWSNFAWLLSKKQGRKIIEISTVIFIFWSNFEWFMLKYYSSKTFSFWIESQPSFTASIMILKKFGKTFIREILSRIEISEFSEICLYESFEICYLRKFLRQVSPNKISVYTHVLEPNSDNLNPHVTKKLVCQVGW